MAISPSRSAGWKLAMKKNRSWNVMSSMAVIGSWTLLPASPCARLPILASSSTANDGAHVEFLEPGHLAMVHQLEELVQFQFGIGPKHDRRLDLAAAGELLGVGVLVLQPGLGFQQRHRPQARNEDHGVLVAQTLLVLRRELVDELLQFHR